MAVFNKDFFKDNDVLLVGYSSKNGSFSRMVYQAFIKKGIEVFPINPKANDSYDVKVYPSVDGLPKVPETAYIIVKKENIPGAVHSLLGKGVKRILFQTKAVDQETLNACRKNGIETAFGCPMMVLGTGLHKLHAFFAGVR